MTRLRQSQVGRDSRKTSPDVVSAAFELTNQLMIEGVTRVGLAPYSPAP